MSAYTLSSAAAAAAAILTRGIRVRIEFSEGEAHLPENGAGIRAAVRCGFLIRQAEIAGREYQLNQTLHAYDGKHADGDIYSLRADIVHKIAVEIVPYIVGNSVGRYAADTERMASLFYLYIQTNGIRHFHGYGGESRLYFALQILGRRTEVVAFGIRGINRYVLFGTVKNDFLVENGKALDYFRFAHAQADFKGHAEIETDDYLIKSLVERDRIKTDMGIDNFDTFAADSGGSVNYLLIAIAEMDSDVLQTILIFREVEYLVHANAAKRVGGLPAKRAGRDFVNHIYSS